MLLVNCLKIPKRWSALGMTNSPIRPFANPIIIAAPSVATAASFDNRKSDFQDCMLQTLLYVNYSFLNYAVL